MLGGGGDISVEGGFEKVSAHGEFVMCCRRNKIKRHTNMVILIASFTG